LHQVGLNRDGSPATLIDPGSGFCRAIRGPIVMQGDGISGLGQTIGNMATEPLAGSGHECPAGFRMAGVSCHSTENYPS